MAKQRRTQRSESNRETEQRHTKIKTTFTNVRCGHNVSHFVWMWRSFFRFFHLVFFFPFFSLVFRYSPYTRIDATNTCASVGELDPPMSHNVHRMVLCILNADSDKPPLLLRRRSAARSSPPSTHRTQSINNVMGFEEIHKRMIAHTANK